MTPAEIVDTLHRDRVRKFKNRSSFIRRHPFVSGSMVYMWENFRHHPTLPNLVEWAAALGYSVDLVPIRKEPSHDNPQ